MEKREAVQTTVKELLSRLGFALEPEVIETAGVYEVKIAAGPEAALLIGYHGEALNSLQTIVGLILFKKFKEKVPLLIDVDNYRRDRSEKLSSLAVRTADKARFLNMPQALPPMTAFERRIVHLAIGGISDVLSESQGEGRERHVVIRPKSPGEESIEASAAPAGS